ncbi:MAG: hypothetical protein FWD69_15895 [Polyangiaceae bacterium]|nr:hypothetical protein [Polyangiaceae bacterium]
MTSARERCEADTVVVADASGLVVAGAGSWPVCEELAAYAPILAEGAWATTSEAVNSRVEALRREVEVRVVSLGEQDVLLCAHRQRCRNERPDNIHDIDQAAAGVRRILSLRHDASR